MTSALYVFGLVLKGTVPEGFKVDGIEAYHSVTSEQLSNIDAIVSNVPIADFVGEEAELRLQNIEWVAPRAVRHQQVIEKILELGPILPAQFGALFSTKEHLEKFVQQNQGAIIGFLELISEKNEWGVKVYCESEKVKRRLLEDEYTEQIQQLQKLSEGARYFKEKQLNSKIDQDVTDRLKTVLVASSTELSNVSYDSRKRKILIDDSNDQTQKLIANWAFLLEKARTSEFMSLVDKLNSSFSCMGIDFRISGPWPPYSFVPDLKWEYS